VADGGSPAPGRQDQVVGRWGELARLDGFVAALPAGPRALLLRGPPGIGKTTLWRAAVERSRAAGCTVLVTRPAEEEMPLALVGLVDLLEPAGADPDTLLAGGDSFARGRTVLAELRRLAAAAPTVLAIDDLQWLDAASARALRYALRRLAAEPVGVVAALRVESAGADDPVGMALALEPERFEVVDVDPLSLGAIRSLVGERAASISRPLLRRIHEASGGNPLYALELARAVLGGGATFDGWATLPLPLSLRAAIADRLDSAPAEVGPVLDVVSAVGAAPLADLREALPDVDVECLVVLAQEHRLLALDDDLTVRFSHPLVASAVYERLGPLARRTLHAWLAERSPDPDVRARHLAVSCDERDGAVAELLEDAARRAAARGAPELAAEFARRSMRLTPAGDPDAAHRRSLAEIEHLASAGEVGRAIAVADELVATLPSGPRRAEALALRVFIDTATGEALLERALAEAGDDELLRGQVLDLLGWLQGMRRGDVARGTECAGEAAAIAARLGERRLQMVAQASLALLEALRGLPESGLMGRALALEDEVGGPPLGRGPWIMHARKLLWDGSLAEARAVFERTREESLRSGVEFQRPYRLYDLALAEYAAGELAAAAEHVREGAEAAGDAENADGESFLLYPLALVEASVGRAAEARAAASRLVEWSASRGEQLGVVRGHGALGLLALAEGDEEAAVRELVTASALLDELGIVHPGAFPAPVDAVEALAACGDLAACGAALARLERSARAVGTAWPTASLARCRGHVLLAGQDPDAAAAAFAEAEEQFERLGYRLDAARAALGRGRAAVRAGRRTLGADVLADARVRFADMGAGSWEARAVEELDRAAPGRAAGELTAAERRVAELVADGKKNREIGQTLFMSVATVEAHLTRIYRKLDLRSRSELARWMVDDAVRAGDA
jgi:DNA-binding CsgD family transcriptional regulator